MPGVLSGSPCPNSGGLQLGLQFLQEWEQPARMRRAYTIGAPSVFVDKNRLGRFPEFRDQGVGGSNPLSPTKSFVSSQSIGMFVRYASDV